jgi:DNA-binding Xre family transcriptional regulator
MLRLRIYSILESRGIANAYNFLVKNGFSPNIATRCVHGKLEQLKLSHINKLCTMLHCTPNDLLEWSPDKNEILSDNHPLKTLERKEKPFNMINHLKQLSFAQVKEVQQLISKISASNSSNPSEEK